MDFDTFGEWVKQRRRVLDLTQEMLAERVGCSISAIRKIESDERRPSHQIAELLAVHLDIASEDRTIFLKIARREGSQQRLKNLSFAASPFMDMPKAPVTTTTIPNPSTPFIGRQQEIVSLNRMLSDPFSRLITILGPGGIGKTRLAIETAADQKTIFGEQIYFVQLSTFSTVRFNIARNCSCIRYPFFE